MCENNELKPTTTTFKERLYTIMCNHPVATIGTGIGIFTLCNYIITKKCTVSAIYEANKKTLRYISKVRNF